MTLSEKMLWAESVIANIKTDKRPAVICKDLRPISDIKHMFDTSSELFGDLVAFRQKEGSSEEFTAYTYRQAHSAVEGLGTALISRGMKDRRIAVIGANSYEWALSYLAVVCGTGIVVPLDKELSETELKAQVIAADISCVLFDPKHESTFRSIKDSGETNLELLVSFNGASEGVESLWSMVDEGRLLVAGGERSFIDAEIDYEAMSILLFTSGTTGKSKGVMLCHKNIAIELMLAPSLFRVETDDVFFSVLPLHHTYECTCGFLIPLYMGASIAYCRGLKHITTDLKDARPSIILAVPLLYEKLHSSIWKNIRKQGKEKLIRRVMKTNRLTKKVRLDLGKVFFKKITDVFGGRMRIMISGGAAIDPGILEDFRAFGINAVQGYGLTECSPMGALNPENAPKSDAIGINFPGTEFKIIDANEEGIGELCIRGDHVMLGYYNMPEETAAVIDEEGWLHTGDLGYIDKDGYAHLSGRKKNVIITKNGKNVYPEELEHQLSLIPFVQESMVFSRDNDAEKDITIVASVRLDDDAVAEILGSEYTEADVKKLVWEEVDKINEEAPFYRRIRKVIVRKTDFLKNSSSKVLRFAEENKLEL